jgi:hypothetical protein
MTSASRRCRGQLAIARSKLGANTTAQAVAIAVSLDLI